MSRIRSNVKRGTVYESVAHYASDWTLMFENARLYNEDFSQIYQDTYTLESVFEEALEAATTKHGIVLDDSPP